MAARYSSRSGIVGDQVRPPLSFEGGVRPPSIPDTQEHKTPSQYDVITSLSNQQMRIHGQLQFDRIVGRLLKPSCLVIKLQEVHNRDVFSNVIGFKV